MARKITKEELVEVGCLNPDEYVKVKEKNLQFRCSDCGDVYVMSLDNRRIQLKKGLNTCNACSLKNSSLKHKVSNKELITLGCLNPTEYISVHTNNLQFKCEGCDDIYTISLSARRQQLKKGLNTCPVCSKKNGASKRKPYKEKLVEVGCLNPEDYENIGKNNLQFKCVDCGDVYVTSLSNRKRQIKRAFNTCPMCSKKNRGAKRKTSKEELIKLGVINPNEYINANENNLQFECKECNSVYTMALAKRKGQIKNGVNTCKSCSKKISGLRRKTSKEELISYGVLNPDDYINLKTPNLKFICSIDGCNNIIENRAFQDYLRGHTRCTQCTKSISKPEIELIEFLKEIGIDKNDIKSQSRVLKREDQRPLELDIYLPSYNLAIEFHGDRWHSVWYRHSKNSEIKDRPNMKTLHHEKYILAKEQEIRLIQIHEHEWKNPILKKKLKSLIKHTLGKSTYKEKIYARKCVVRRIDKDKANLFLDKYHLQGATQQGTVDLGLFYQDELVAVTSFVTYTLSIRHNDKHELIRHATNTNYLIIGALGKTLSHYKKNHHDKIYTFCDVEKFNGTSYIKAGFKESYFSKPQYYYVVGGIKYHKRLFQRQKIANKFPEFEFKTYGESSMLKELINEGYEIYKIYDAGKICFESC